MAVRQSTTGAWDHHRVPRPTAPACLLAGGDLAALLGRRADVERALDRALGPVDDFDHDPEGGHLRSFGRAGRGGRHG